MQEYFEIGQIVNTFGIKGEIKIVPFTDDMDRFNELKSLYIEVKKKLEKFEIQNVRIQKNVVIIKLQGIDTMEKAELYKGCYIKIHRKDARKLPEGTYFIADIIGSQVITDEGNFLGYVEDIYNTGSKDIYVVKDDNGKQILLPSIEDVILDIDVEKQIVKVHLLEGLV